MNSEPAGTAPADPWLESDERRAFLAKMQQVAHRVAFEPRAWDAGLAREVASIFDGRAETWWTHRSPEYLRPLADAIDAAGTHGGLSLDIGSGTSLHEGTLLSRFDHVVAVDLSAEMLRLAERSGAGLVRADAASLPIRDESADLIVCVNMFLFPGEFTRVLKDDGVIAHVSTSGRATPIYLSPANVADALVAHGDARFATVSGTSGEACWTIARRTGR